MDIEIISTLIQKYVEDGQLGYARQTAELLKRTLTTEELETILRKCVENEWLDDTLNIVSLLRQRK